MVRQDSQTGKRAGRRYAQGWCWGIVMSASQLKNWWLLEIKVMCIWCVANRSSGLCSKCHPQTLLCYCLCQFYQYFLGYWSYWYLFFNTFMRKVSLLWLWQILNLHNLFKINARVQALFVLVWPNVQETAVSLSQEDACSSQRKQT